MNTTDVTIKQVERAGYNLQPLPEVFRGNRTAELVHAVWRGYRLEDERWCSLDESLLDE